MVFSGWWSFCLGGVPAGWCLCWAVSLLGGVFSAGWFFLAVRLFLATFFKISVFSDVWFFRCVFFSFVFQMCFSDVCFFRCVFFFFFSNVFFQMCCSGVFQIFSDVWFRRCVVSLMRFLFQIFFFSDVCCFSRTSFFLLYVVFSVACGSSAVFCFGVFLLCLCFF